jgi:hypothetical protein
LQALASCQYGFSHLVPETYGHVSVPTELRDANMHACSSEWRSDVRRGLCDRSLFRAITDTAVLDALASRNWASRQRVTSQPCCRMARQPSPRRPSIRFRWEHAAGPRSQFEKRGHRLRDPPGAREGQEEVSLRGSSHGNQEQQRYPAAIRDRTYALPLMRPRPRTPTCVPAIVCRGLLANGANRTAPSSVRRVAARDLLLRRCAHREGGGYCAPSARADRNACSVSTISAMKVSSCAASAYAA